MDQLNDKVILLDSYDNYAMALNIKNILDVNEIESFIADDHMITINPILGLALGGYKIYINGKDLERTRKLLLKNYPEIKTQAEGISNEGGMKNTFFRMDLIIGAIIFIAFLVVVITSR